MPLTDISVLCSDFVLDRYPDANGEQLADLMAAAVSEAESLAHGAHHALCDRDIRSHLHTFFDGYQVEPGQAERVARANWYRELCSTWISDLDTEDLLPTDLAFAIDLAVSEARAQMNEGRWPTAEMARERMLWLLRQAVSRQRQAVRRRNA